ncbi:hypothetical protein Barb6_00393 [Bacteroidales bacterium Barb6]|nr:hypothetical protein Barb6_00393 [Bacteroidales bacterium Barb6]
MLKKGQVSKSSINHFKINNMTRTLCMAAVVCCLTACGNKSANETVGTAENEPKWESLFNGENLDRWTVKITGYPSGENFGNTFRVEDGLLKVRYDGYDAFNYRFGHIFTDKSYSHYKLRVEYRFTGEQLAGAPEWAYRNSGAMLHAQAPETMHIDQDFPVSIEAQMLGGDGEHDRPTGNVCTPGTEIDIEGEHYTGHCANSRSKTYHGDQWVTMEMVVLGDSIIHHIIEGDTVISYSRPIIAGGNVSPASSLPEGPLKEGRISLQSEGHPVDFRKVEIMDLSNQ